MESHQGWALRTHPWDVYMTPPPDLCGNVIHENSCIFWACKWKYCCPFLRSRSETNEVRLQSVSTFTITYTKLGGSPLPTKQPSTKREKKGWKRAACKSIQVLKILVFNTLKSYFIYFIIYNIISFISFTTSF